MPESKYPVLLSPFHLGSLTIRNRVVMPPMTTNFATVDGFVTDRLIDYYAARAAGGTGMVIVEMAGVDAALGRAEVAQLAIDHDKYLPGFSDLAAAIKRQGAAAFQQIHHGGRKAVHTTGQPVAPSAIAAPGGPMPRALTVDEIHDLVDKYASGAQRSMQAGFDGIEFHAAHAYLLTQFMSPLSNLRQDEYGGPLENRARFLLEVVRETRRRLGADFPICVRLAGDEFTPGGITIEETKTVAQWLQEAGVSLLHISAGTAYNPKVGALAPQCFPTGYFLSLAASVKQVVNIPVIAVCRLKEPVFADAALREGKCDLVAVGRAQIADAAYVNKVAAGREAEIRPCISCNTCGHVTLIDEQRLVCTVNPAAGRERELALEPAAKRKKVVIVGGGPAGLEAAQQAAERGHEVHLFERQSDLGGQLRLAAVPPHKAELGALADYLADSIDKLGVTVYAGRDVEARSILDLKPDSVVLAAGAQPVAPRLPGTGPRVTFSHDLLAFKVEAKGRIVVVGGGMVGSETAEYLATQPSNKVTIVEMLSQVAADMIPMLRVLLIERLAKAGVDVMVETKAVELVTEGLRVSGKGGDRVLPADWIVWAIGARPDDALRVELEGKVPELHVVGDASKPRRILEAIHEGAAVGLAI